ncbi:hypothetical protein E0I56_014110 [Escherichia coli]|nr:hypothetical protein [Escherichia coli]
MITVSDAARAPYPTYGQRRIAFIRIGTHQCRMHHATHPTIPYSSIAWRI